MRDSMVQDEVDEHLLPVFLEEASDILPQVGSAMRAWRERSEDKAPGRSLHRSLHTLKGSARMAGAMRVGNLMHHMEERVVQAMSQAQPDAAFMDELKNCFDGIANALEQLRNVDPAAAVPTAPQADEAPVALSAPTHANPELRQSLLAARMAPFANISERLYRIVRQTCKELNKEARLELGGAETKIDRRVLGRMTAPLEHMLRNAIAHGLESPQQRAHAGKPPTGVICLSLYQESDEMIFELSDDGAGINIAHLRQKAAELGVPQTDEGVGGEQALQLISTPGLTTATEVTEISGRGVGMDVVRSEITALGGQIEVSSEPGEGTRFIIRLPRTLTAARQNCEGRPMGLQ